MLPFSFFINLYIIHCKVHVMIRLNINSYIFKKSYEITDCYRNIKNDENFELHKKPSL